MTATSTTRGGRAFAQKLMVDTCLITRVTGTTTTPDTGVVTYTTTQIYAGPCRFQGPPAASSSPTELGQAHVFQQTPTLQVPITVTGVQPDDVVTAVTSVLDPDLLGRTWRVRGDGEHKTHLTKRTYELVEVVG